MSRWSKFEKLLQYAEHADFLAKIIAWLLVSLFGGKVVSIFTAQWLNLSPDWKTAIWLLVSGLLFFVYLWLRPREKPDKSTLPLRIKSATYGVDDDRYREVTTQVRAQIKNNRINFLVSNNTLMGGADPFYGEVKHLVVKYSLGNGPTRQIIRREYDQLELPEP